MNTSASPAPSKLLTPLAERCPLPAADAARVFETLLAQVAALHDQGRLHRELTAEHVRVDGSLGVRLTASDEIVALGEGTELAEVCPPELQGPQGWVVPAEIERARAAFAAAGIACDPRRIDVYQLGALLCRMLTGQSVTAYLQSPRARGQVPAPFRPLLDGALGYDAAKRIANCDELRAAFQAATAAGADDPQKTSQFSDTPFSDTPFGSSIGREQNTPVSAPPATGAHPVATDIEQLGPYKIVARIGGGGMGDVYKAYEPALDRHVAIKVLPAALARHEDFVRRFRAEATAVAKLVHPNIVQIHAIGEDAGHHYFAMQFVEGESLAELLRRRQRLPLSETLSIVEQCLHGLAAAHQQQLIHRDVKPGNILLESLAKPAGKGGQSPFCSADFAKGGQSPPVLQRALLADFGLVKKIQSGNTLTATGVIMGTVDYIPPEQARGLPVDGRADLYSLGVLMYQMLSGRLPFAADTPTGMIFQHAYEPPIPLAEVAPDVPPPIAAMITRLMAKNPDDRYQTAADVLADIAAYRSGKPVVDRPDQDDSASPGYDAITDTFAPVGSWRTRLLNQFRRHAPEIAGKLENTAQQVDGAVFQYEQRRNRLAQLVHDAEEATAALAAQEASHRQAAQDAAAATDPAAAARLKQEQAGFEKVAADFAAQLAEQQAQNEQLHSQLAEVDGRLASLRSQRDVLRARLRAAQARIQIEGGVDRSRRWKWPAIVIGSMAACVVLLLCASRFFSKGEEKAVPTVTAPPMQSYPDSDLLGIWEWPVKSRVSFYEDQTFVSYPEGIAGTWKCTNAKERQYELTWPNEVDNVTLSTDRDHLAGHSNLDTNFSTWRSVGNPESRIRRSPLLGGIGGPVFYDEYADDHPDVARTRYLVGFETTVVNGQSAHLRSIQAIFKTNYGYGETVHGAVHGMPRNDHQIEMANQGYAVTGMVGKHGDLLNGFQLIFTRVNRDGSLAANDSYVSKWIGVDAGITEKKLGVAGRPVIGIYGHAGSSVDSIGIIQPNGPDANKPVSPKTPSESPQSAPVAKGGATH